MPRPGILFLGTLTAIALVLCVLLLSPFFTPIVFAGVFAIALFPLHQRILRKVRRPNAAAGISILVVLVGIIVPAILLTGAISKEVASAYKSISPGSGPEELVDSVLSNGVQPVTAWLQQYIDLSGIDFVGELKANIRQLAGFLVGRFSSLIGGTAKLLFDIVTGLFVLFFLFRDGRTMARRVGASIPLGRSQVRELYSAVVETTRANVNGVAVVALAQGFLQGLAFLILGLPSALLWGAVTALCSMIPVIGAPIVWIPAGVYLLATGPIWKGIVMLCWGAFVVSTIDNFLRPYIMQSRSSLNLLQSFFALLGGIQVFGFLGIFLGPVVFVVAFRLLKMLRAELRHDPGLES